MLNNYFSLANAIETEFSEFESCCFSDLILADWEKPKYPTKQVIESIVTNRMSFGVAVVFITKSLKDLNM